MHLVPNSKNKNTKRQLSPVERIEKKIDLLIIVMIIIELARIWLIF